MAESKSPSGPSPPFGDKFCQKILWLICPPPLNLRAGISEIWADAQSFCEKQLIRIYLKDDFSISTHSLLWPPVTSLQQYSGYSRMPDDVSNGAVS